MIPQTKLAFFAGLAATTVLASPIQRRAVEFSSIKFSSIDISRKPLNGNAAKQEAQRLCPQSDGVKVLQEKRLTAQAVEVDVFNPAIAAARAAGNRKLLEALLCQQNRNKVLINTCQLMKALIENTRFQIDQNNVQIPQNIEAVEKFCPGADTSLFIGNEANKGSTPAVAPAVANTDNYMTSKNKASPGNIQFADIDISKKAGVGNDALAAAKSVCLFSDGADLLEKKRRVAEDTEVKKFNPAINAAKAAKNDALVKALLCQQNRNKVLKNTCQLERARIVKDQGQIDENSQQVPANMQRVDKFCPGADESLFI